MMGRKQRAGKFLLLILLLTSCIACGSNTRDTDNKLQDRAEVNTAFEKLKSKADTAHAYCRRKGMNVNYCILIDFSIHSGRNRIFVWDFANDTIKYAGLCCHGAGRGSTHSQPVYSNDVGSNCSSLGYYKIGIRSYSNWGIKVHYKMHGLDASNSNAYKRIVVFHAHTPVPANETFPRHLPLGYSLGCPVVSNELMRNVDLLLQSEKKPMLMWIYD